ncbi:MAG: SDR family oxidoreductase [Cytophagales bacterium]|nr:SDR family oxidoreductase [Cytophagales bacterium]MDW8383444.1 SDR family oxidoreductase [Flammeovirgaceae bacterium]
MAIDLKGKRAVVCGATQGIGLACAQLLAQAGAEIVLLARDEQKIKQVVRILPNSVGQIHTYQVADFEKPTQVERAAQQIAQNKIHILVNNTGGPAPGKILEATISEFLKAFEMHLINFQILVQRFVPLMKQENYGRIINIISTSVKTPIPGLGVSNTIRGAVASWAKTLAGELAVYNITVNNVLPGLTQTNRLQTLIEKRANEAKISFEEQSSLLKQTIPAKRFALPSETAAAVAFLASPLASYITGINLPVDGGLTPCL